MSEPRLSLESFRKAFPQHQTSHSYMNNAAIGPLPQRAIDAMNEHLQQKSIGKIDHFEHDFATSEACRSLCAQLIGATDPNRICFIPNTGTGLNQIVQAMRWEAGDEVIINDLEFPSNVYPYLNLQRKGVSIVTVKTEHGIILPEQIFAAVTPKTRLIALSAVQYLTGFRADLAQIGQFCKEHNIFFVVDGIQAAGVCPVDISQAHVDAFVTGTHKWLCANYGFGFMYLSEALFNAMEDLPLGWLSVEKPWELSNFNQKPVEGPRRLEIGVWNTMGFIALKESLSLILDTGVDEIYHRVVSVVNDLRVQIMQLGGWDPIIPNEVIKAHPSGVSGILTFRPPAGLTAEAVVHHLRSHDIHISSREGLVRFSPHGYASYKDDVLRVVEVLRLME